jgi:hypothetical protein
VIHPLVQVYPDTQLRMQLSNVSTPSPGGCSGQRACSHAQLGIPETAHGPTLKYHKLPHGSSTHSLTHSSGTLQAAHTVRVVRQGFALALLSMLMAAVPAALGVIPLWLTVC